MLSIESIQGGYASRTKVNASSGFTVAVAVDFHTSGETLTKRVSSKGYHKVPFGECTSRHALAIIKKLGNEDVLNIAGNAIYRFKEYGFDQFDVNMYIFSLLSKIHDNHKISCVISGGQTGADIAGLVSAVALGIDCVGRYPKGFKMRFKEGVDIYANPNSIYKSIYEMAEELKTNDCIDNRYPLGC